MGHGSRSEASSGPATWAWIGAIALASVLLSRAFACAMPFAALATLAAFNLPRREAVVLVILGWIANQVVGFGLLHYPWTAPTIAWGVAIGVAAIAGLIAARAVAERVSLPRWAAIPLALAIAFTAYEIVLFATTWVLPSGTGTFAPPVLMRIFAINVAAIGLLLAAHKLTALVGWPQKSPAAA